MVVIRRLGRWVKDEDGWFYCDLDDGHRIVSTTKTIDGFECTFTETGYLSINKTILIKYDGNIYAIDTEGQYLNLKGWQTIEGNTYYFTDKSTAMTGFLDIRYGNEPGSDGYYFNDEGMLQKNTFYTDDSGKHIGNALPVGSRSVMRE